MHVAKRTRSATSAGGLEINKHIAGTTFRFGHSSYERQGNPPFPLVPNKTAAPSPPERPFSRLGRWIRRATANKTTRLILRKSRSSFRLAKRVCEAGCEVSLRIRAKKPSDLNTSPSRTDRKPHQAKFDMLVLVEANPGWMEPPFPPGPFGADLRKQDFERRHDDILVGAGGSEIRMKRKIEDRNIEPDEASHGPSPHQDERHARGKADESEEGQEHCGHCGASASDAGRCARRANASWRDRRDSRQGAGGCRHERVRDLGTNPSSSSLSRPACRARVPLHALFGLI